MTLPHPAIVRTTPWGHRRRLLGSLVALLVLTGCSTPTGDGSDGETPDPASQARLGREALEAARPGLTAALAPTDHSFGGSHMSCRLGRNDFEYTINGGVLAGAGTWATGVDAISDEDADQLRGGSRIEDLTGDF